MISLIYLFDFHSFFRNNLQAWEIIMDRYTAQQRLALVRLLFHKQLLDFLLAENISQVSTYDLGILPYKVHTMQQLQSRDLEKRIEFPLAFLHVINYPPLCIK